MTIQSVVTDVPSNSKGWGRVRITDGNGVPLFVSKTGNPWLGKAKGGKTAEATPGQAITIEIQVMLRVGSGRTAREEITTGTFEYVAGSGPQTFCHRPGSQGATVVIS